MTLVIENFTKEEEKLIEDTVEKLKKERRYSDKPRLYHDAIVAGCRSLTQGK